LVSQLEATLEGLPVDVRIRTTKINNQTYLWPDSTSEDYIHLTLCLEGVCSYEMTMHYKKAVKSNAAVKSSFGATKRMNDTNTDDFDDDNEDCLFWFKVTRDLISSVHIHLSISLH
jgi:hypothetical protein